MHKLLRNSIIMAICLAVSLWAIFPPEKKLRRGKDLAGGVSLIYGVTINPGETDTLNKVISVVKERLDPNGVMEISVIGEGANRIEITMPLPSDQVKKMKAAVEGELTGLASGSLSAEQFERIASSPPAEREKEIVRLGAGSEERRDHIERAFRARDEIKTVRAELDEARRKLGDIRATVDALKKVNPEDPLVQQVEASGAPLQQSIDEKAVRIADLEIGYEADRAASLTAGLNPDELRRALRLSDKDVVIAGEDTKVVRLPSPRRRAIDDIYTRFPAQKAQVEAVVARWGDYEKQRRSLDDPQDIVRILKGAGVLNFRITPSSGEVAGEQDLRRQLREGGPRSVRSEEGRWYRLNKIENWVRSEKDIESIKTGAAAFFQAMGYIVEEYKGEYYMLCWDRGGLRLTENDGLWSVTAYQGQDSLGRPAIDFRMDALGADKLGRLTGPNVGKQMAVLLDDEVYTAPRLQSRISSQGQITGSFTKAEIDYIVRVLSAGSLQAKLTPEPISSSVLGPQLGADNLQRGLRAGVIAFFVVAGFMVAYYFSCGLISILALVINCLMLVGAMALNQAAFTLPGIAGVILTFGMAVDANVLIYERMREEMNLGHDLRTAVRLGYQRALSAIVDGQITTLIVCVVLAFTGTQEIKGFALTLGIGVVTTLFAQLFFTRFLFAILVEKVRIKRLSMLAMMVPGLQRLLTPHMDWMRIRGYSYALSVVIAGSGVFFLFYEGRNLLGTEFRGGTAVTIEFKEDNGVPVTMTRAEVESRVKKLAEAAERGSPLKDLQFAEVIAVNPDSSNVRSGTFTVKSLVTDPKLIQATLITAFADKVETRIGLKFDGSEMAPDRGAPAYPVSTPSLGDSIDRPDVRRPSGEFYNGLAIVVANIEPPITLADLRTRLEEVRGKAAYSDTLIRSRDVLAIEGSDGAVRTAVILVTDPAVPYVPGDQHWANDVRDREWRLAHEALAENQTLASVQAFSPAVASTFRAQAVVAVLLSTLMVIIYVWVRFSSFRYSIAAITTTLHDCLVAIGFVALATVIYRNFPSLAGALGILPFKIDLNVVAAVLTVLGYSLNDTIIVMDRIRENRGKLPYASRSVINGAINQTISRTVITAGTTFLATMVLYLFGGEGVRVFAYTMLIGILVGTFSSIAVAAPLVWVKAVDPHENPADAQGVGSIAAAAKTAA